MDRKFLKLILDVAERLTVAGAEISRVEESVTRICHAYGCRRVDIYATTANIMLTVETAEGELFTQDRRIPQTGIDMERMDKLNDLARWMASAAPSAEEILPRLSKIDAIVNKKRYVILCNGIIASAFCIFFGSRSVAEIGVALALGLLIGVFSLFADRVQLNKILTRFICSFFSATVVQLCLLAGLIGRPDFIIIGCIMNLIPGVGLTNALRDLFVGDMLTGTLRSIEAVLLTVAIVIGFAVPEFLLGGGF